MLQFLRPGLEVPVGAGLPEAVRPHPHAIGMKRRQPANTGIQLCPAHGTSPPGVSGSIQIFQHQQHLVPGDFCPEASRNTGQTGNQLLCLPLIPVSFHLIGLELSLVGQVRVPSSRMTTGSRLDVLDDHAGNVRTLQANPYNTAIPTPERLHSSKGRKTFCPGNFQDKPVHCLLIHGVTSGADPFCNSDPEQPDDLFDQPDGYRGSATPPPRHLRGPRCRERGEDRY